MPNVSDESGPGLWRMYYEPGHLASVGQVWILESVRPGDFRAGERLTDDLAGILDGASARVPVEFRKLVSALELMTALDDLAASVAATGLSPILDIECHGNQSGLQLTDGSFLRWDEIKPKLEAINLASRFNLILMLGCCNGAYFASTTRLAERSAFCAYVGPTNSVAAGTLYDGFLAFYRSLFTDRDLTLAVRNLRAAAGNLPSICATAMGFFRMSMAAYIRNWTTDQQLEARAQAIAAAGRSLLSVPEIAQRIRDHGPVAFETFRRTYFAIDLFEENDARYPLTFEQVVLEAAGPDRGGPDAI